MAFMTDRVRGARNRQKQALIAEAGKLGAHVVDVIEIGDDARAASGAIGGSLTAMIGGGMRVDTVMLLHLQTNHWSHYYAQPFSGFNPLPGEHHGILHGALATPAIARADLRYADSPWDPAAGPELARQLAASPHVRRMLGSIVWEWAVGMTKVTIDWAIQLRSVGDGTTHVVMQSGRYGGLTTYDVGFAQWMQVCQALHPCLAAWAPPAQAFPVPTRYGELIHGCSTASAGAAAEPASAPPSRTTVSVDYVATVRQALAPHVGKKIWIGAETIPAKKLGHARAALPPQLAGSPILAAIDLTVFGSAKDVIVVTPTHIVVKEYDDHFAYELAGITSIVPGQSPGASAVKFVVDRLGEVQLPTGTHVSAVFELVDAIARANAGQGEVHAHVSAFIGSGPDHLSMDEAQAVAEQAQAAMQTGGVHDEINAAARLLLGGQYQAAVDAYLAIAQAHPEYTGTCYGQVGAALFFMEHYGRAIEYYEAAKQYGEDVAAMDENIREAREHL
jgi:hypothetical protein